MRKGTQKQLHYLLVEAEPPLAEPPLAAPQTPSSLCLLAAQLVASGRLRLNALAPHLSPTTSITQNPTVRTPPFVK